MKLNEMVISYRFTKKIVGIWLTYTSIILQGHLQIRPEEHNYAEEENLWDSRVSFIWNWMFETTEMYEKIWEMHSKSSNP